MSVIFRISAMLIITAASGCKVRQKFHESALSQESRDPMPDGISRTENPCDRLDHWKYSLKSRRLPVIVHYAHPEDIEESKNVLAAIEEGWDFNTKTLQLLPIPLDHGKCGGTGDFDAFVWKGLIACEISAIPDVIVENFDAPVDQSKYGTGPGQFHAKPPLKRNGRMGFMKIDPWGKYGGPDLRKTVVHEMAHASQAAYDWDESGAAFEMFAVFLDQIFNDSYEPNEFPDFQKHPNLPVDFFDDYETEFMYGASLYLLFLKDRYFDNSPLFVKDVWELSTNPPGADDTHREINEPDFVDVLDFLLHKQTKGKTSFIDSVVEFARWRWYTGDRVDDRHFRHFTKGIENLKDVRAAPAVFATLSETGWIDVTSSLEPLKSLAPLMLGSVYIDLEFPGSESVDISIPALGGDTKAKLVVQALPGIDANSDGDFVTQVETMAKIKLINGKRTLAITVVPLPSYGAYDPDSPRPQISFRAQVARINK